MLDDYKEREKYNDFTKEGRGTYYKSKVKESKEKVHQIVANHKGVNVLHVNKMDLDDLVWSLGFVIDDLQRRVEKLEAAEKNRNK